MVEFTQEELDNEEWRDIKDYEGLYQISSLGRVKSLDRTVTAKDGKVYKMKGKMLNFVVGTKGYHQVILSKNSRQRTFSNHRLVAIAFIPNPENKEQVNHINEIKTDNRLSNLEWTTQSENVNHGTAIERAVSRRSKAITQCDMDGNPIKEWVSAIEIERVLGFSSASIRRCCRGQIKSFKGSIWKYKNPEEASTYNRRIYQYTTKGELVKIWDNALQIKEGGFSIKQVQDCCNGRYHTSGGFVWRYEGDAFSYVDHTKVSKKVVQLTKDLVVIKEWESITQIVEEFGCDRSNIAKCCRGIYNTSQGFKWMYLDDYIKMLEEKGEVYEG